MIKTRQSQKQSLKNRRTSLLLLTFEKLKVLFYVSILILLTSNAMFSQKSTVADSSHGSQIIVENADQAIVETDKSPQVTKYIGNVRAYHEGAFIFCDNAILTGNNLYAVGNVSIIEADTLQIYADTLIYQGDSAIAYLVKDVILINNDDTLYSPDLKYDMSSKVANYTNKALMKDAKNTLKSQLGTYNTATKEAWFYEKVSLQGDSLTLVTDTLRYNTEQKTTSWYSPCFIQNKNAKLYSDLGDYNIDTKSGIFKGNAQYEEDTIRAYADTIVYNGETDLISLFGNSSYISTNDTATSDTIIYDRKNELIEMIGNADYRGQESRAKGEKLKYDKRNETFKFEGRSALEDAPVFIEADFLDYNKNKQEGLAIGNVVYRDTTEGIIIWADTLDYKGEINYMRATACDRKPVLGTEIDGDTTYISAMVLRTFQTIGSQQADSLLVSDSIVIKMDGDSIVQMQDSIPSQIIEDSLIIINKVKSIVPDTNKYFVPMDSLLSSIDSSMMDSITMANILTMENDSLLAKKQIDTINYLIAEHDVVMYKKDMQARSDSLAFNDMDSIFTFFYNPVMWTDTTQISGDTIRIALKENKISYLKVNDNAFMLNSSDLKFYNQIRGKILIGNFKD